jgi:hypothetical protein
MCSLGKALYNFSNLCKNMKTSIFKEVPIEVDNNANNKEEDTNIDLHLESIMDRNLSQVAEITTTNNKSSISTLEEFCKENIWFF